MGRFKCVDCTLYFEAEYETPQCQKCAGRVEEGAVAPSSTTESVPVGEGIWGHWSGLGPGSGYFGPGSRSPLVYDGVGWSTVPMSNADFLPVEWADVARGLDKPDANGTYFTIECQNKMADDFKGALRRSEDAIVQAFALPPSLISRLAPTNAQIIAQLRAQAAKDDQLIAELQTEIIALRAKLARQ